MEMVISLTATVSAFPCRGEEGVVVEPGAVVPDGVGVSPTWYDGLPDAGRREKLRSFFSGEGDFGSS